MDDDGMGDVCDDDVDGDGWIDALFIIHAGSGEEQSLYEFDIWSHMGSTLYFTNDGVNAGSYSTEPEDGRVGVFAHEFGHVLGLPAQHESVDRHPLQHGH